jgi:hypothetical protein
LAAEADPGFVSLVKGVLMETLGYARTAAFFVFAFAILVVRSFRQPI